MAIVLNLSLAEAAAVCLAEQGHRDPVTLTIDILGLDSLSSLSFSFIWQDPSDQVKRFWADEEYATEHGAYGIAALILPYITGLEVMERSPKGTGFDFWLGSPETDAILFQRKARLEVSGIRQGSSRDVQARIQRKLRQTDRSQGPMVIYVLVVEFSSPYVRVVKK